MQVPRIARAGVAVVLVLAAALAGCTLPRSGPTAGEHPVGRQHPELDMHVVTVTPAIAAASRSSETLGFGPDFVGAGTVSPDTIAPATRSRSRSGRTSTPASWPGSGRR